MLQTFAHRFEQSLQKIQLPAAISTALTAQRFNLAGVVIPAGLDAETHEAVRQAIDTAFVSGFRELMLISAALAIVSAVAAALMIRGGRPSPTQPKPS
jgi:hypothetical protein